jgi:hypothetical protein
LFTRGTRESIVEARAMYRRAIEFDHNFAAPHAGLAQLSLLAASGNDFGGVKA